MKKKGRREPVGPILSAPTIAHGRAALTFDYAAVSPCTRVVARFIPEQRDVRIAAPSPERILLHPMRAGARCCSSAVPFRGPALAGRVLYGVGTFPSAEAPMVNSTPCRGGRTIFCL